jgi:tripartite-type tricarboxylate transporter receptor subunit TctC
VLRVIADRLGQTWGQQVLAINHPGATGSIASRIAAEAPPDGYTLYMPVLSSFVSLPGMAPNVPIQLPRDFSAIGFAGENPMFVVVNPSLGITKLSDLIGKAKARPGEISCAVTGVGRLTHLTAELLQSRTGIKLLIVPYTGGPAQAISDVVSGRVQSGSVKAIAVASEKRLAEFPTCRLWRKQFPIFRQPAGKSWWRRLARPKALFTRRAWIYAASLPTLISRRRSQRAEAIREQCHRPKSSPSLWESNENGNL